MNQTLAKLKQKYKNSLKKFANKIEKKENTSQTDMIKFLSTIRSKFCMKDLCISYKFALFLDC